MAKFIDLIENGGTIENEKTGEQTPWHNFLFGYLDTVTKMDEGRNEMDSTKERYFQIKIKADKIHDFFGFEVFCASQFNGLFGREIELTYGRDGVCGAKFVEPVEFSDNLALINGTEEIVKNKKKA